MQYRDTYTGGETIYIYNRADQARPFMGFISNVGDHGVDAWVFQHGGCRELKGLWDMEDERMADPGPERDAAFARGAFTPTDFTRFMLLAMNAKMSNVGKLYQPTKKTYPVRDRAEAWLRRQLEKGPCYSTELYKAASQAGIGRVPLQEAKKAMGVVVEREGHIGPWFWRMPAVPTDAPVAAEASTNEPLDGNTVVVGEEEADGDEEAGAATPGEGEEEEYEEVEDEEELIEESTD